MTTMPARAISLAAICLLGAGLACAQDWKTATTLPAVDLNGLTPTQKNTALKLLRERDCSCGCGMKVAECRVKDPNCGFSRGLSSTMVEAVKKGKSEKDALAAADASSFAKGPVRDTRVLGDPVSIATAGAPVIGPASARITLVEFSDFQCPYCVSAVPQLQAVMKAYPNDVKLIFKQFPLDIHSQAALASAAALAAQKQGKFWQMHDGLFAMHGHLARQPILDLAKTIGLDMKRFEVDMGSPEIQKAVARDVEEGNRAGVEGTPTLFVDGKHYNGPIDAQALKPILDAELKPPAK